MRDYLIPVRMAILEKQITNAGEHEEKKEPLYTVGGTIIWHSHYGNKMERIKKLKL